MSKTRLSFSELEDDNAGGGEDNHPNDDGNKAFVDDGLVEGPASGQNASHRLGGVGQWQQRAGHAQVVVHTLNRPDNS